MNKRSLFRHCARVSIEFTTPFLVGGGNEDLLFDTSPVLDAFGLPCIPGTSLAGVLRHAFERTHGFDKAKDIFGYAPEGSRGAGQGSRLWLSFGRIHNSKNMPVDGPVDKHPPADDEVLAAARVPTMRDHVRIDFRGVAADNGKFDQAALQAGHRFTFDMLIEGEEAHGADLDCLLDLLGSGEVRIGASQHGGFGSFKVIDCRKASYDLEQPEGRKGFADWPVRLDRPLPSVADRHAAGSNAPAPVFKALELELEAEGFWGVNGNEAWGFDSDIDEKLPDMCPFRDVRIEWVNDRGRLSGPIPVIPATAIKGALAHRVAFHFNTYKELFADRAQVEEEQTEDWLENNCGRDNEAVRQLFGGAADSGDDMGRAGRVIIDDVWLNTLDSGDFSRVMHNSIDRFTGGTRTGFLFEEMVIAGKGFNMVLKVMEPGKLSDMSKRALCQALRDLAEGRLQLGAGSGRGNGYFRGSANASQALDSFEKEIRS